MQSSNKYNYALIFTYLKYSLCNAKKKNGYPICLSSCSSFFLVCFLIVLMNVFKNSWENLGGWVSKSLFWHHVYLIGWLVNHISSFKGLFCCCLAFRVAVENMDASYSVDFEHKKNIYIYTYAYTCIFSRNIKDFSLWSMFWNFTRTSLIMCFSFILYRCYWALSIWKSMFCNKKCSSVTF